MRIVLCVHCFFPHHFYGTETYTLEVAKNLRALGHDAIVVSAVFPGEPKREEVITYYEYEGIPVYCIDKNYFPNTRIKDTYYQPEIRTLLKTVLNKIKPDLLHITHLINHTAVILEVAEELYIPAIATFTDFFGFCFNNKLEAADGSLCRGPNGRRTNCLACVLRASSRNPGATSIDRLAGRHRWSSFASFMLLLLIGIPGFRKGKIAGFVYDITKRPEILASCYSRYHAAIAPTRFLRDVYIANGFTMPVYEIRFGVDLPREPKPRRKPGSVITFGYIGQIAPHKGTDILIDAFCRLPGGLAELRVFGPQDQDPLYMKSLEEKVDGRAVFFCGTFPKEKMVDVFTEMDFLVIPSRWYENSPLVLLSALASHTPVIVSDVEGMTEFVEDGKNGYVFPRGSVNDLERVLKIIVKDPDKSFEMSRKTEYARTTRMMTEELVGVYQTVMRLV